MQRSSKKSYIIFTSLCGLVLCAVIVLVAVALRHSTNFFITPLELKKNDFVSGKFLRLAGEVVPHSLIKRGGIVSFDIAEGGAVVHIFSQALLPPLFHEKQQMVIEGHFDNKKNFIAQRIFAKHNEYYKPAHEASKN